MKEVAFSTQTKEFVWSVFLIIFYNKVQEFVSLPPALTLTPIAWKLAPMAVIYALLGCIMTPALENVPSLMPIAVNICPMVLARSAMMDIPQTLVIP